MASSRPPPSRKPANDKASDTVSDRGHKKNEMSKSGVDQELIRQLAALLTETDLSEIEIETDDLKLRVARQMAPAITHVSAPAHAPAAPAATAAPAETASLPGTVTSPMVGTTYLSPEPGAPAFVQVGTSVSEGQTILIIEAMKTMNHIPAIRAGKVTAIFVEDGQPVEFGEPLFAIE